MIAIAMKTVRTNPADYHARQAKLEEAAVTACAAELSTTTNSDRRSFLVRKAQEAKKHAQFHRNLAARLRLEASAANHGASDDQLDDMVKQSIKDHGA